MNAVVNNNSTQVRHTKYAVFVFYDAKPCSANDRARFDVTGIPHRRERQADQRFNYAIFAKGDIIFDHAVSTNPRTRANGNIFSKNSCRVNVCRLIYFRRLLIGRTGLHHTLTQPRKDRAGIISHQRDHARFSHKRQQFFGRQTGGGLSCRQLSFTALIGKKGNTPRKALRQRRRQVNHFICRAINR